MDTENSVVKAWDGIGPGRWEQREGNWVKRDICNTVNKIKFLKSYLSLKNY